MFVSKIYTQEETIARDAEMRRRIAERKAAEAAAKEAKKAAKAAAKAAEAMVIEAPTAPVVKAEAPVAVKPTATPETVKKYSSELLARVDELVPLLGDDTAAALLDGLRVVCAVGVQPNRVRLLDFFKKFQATNPNPVEFLGMVEKYLLASPMTDLAGVEQRMERLTHWKENVKSVAKKAGITGTAEQLLALTFMVASDDPRRATVTLYWFMVGNGDAARRFLKLEEYDSYLQNDDAVVVSAFIEKMASSDVPTEVLINEMKEQTSTEPKPEAEQVAPAAEAEPAVTKPVQAPHPQQAQQQPQVQMGKRNKGKPIAVQPAKQPVPYSSTMQQVVPPATLKAHTSLQADPLFAPVDMEVLADVSQRLQQGGLDLSNEGFSQDVISAYKLELANRAEAIARGGK